MNNYMCPPAAKIEPLLAHEYGDGASGKAKQIRNIWKAADRTELEKAVGYLEVREIERYNYHPFDNCELKQIAINRILRSHGVEYLGYDKVSGQHVYYCNAGDTYAATVIFIGTRLIVGCWGDLVERGRIEELQ